MHECDIFIAALSHEDPHERGAFLDQVCSGDTSLRQRVETLLKASGQVGSFLEGSPLATLSRSDTQPHLAEGPGDVIGPYQLTERIGEGGFGVVYMAEQFEPMHRHVALKIIKPGMDTRAVVARFEAERQALALMDHPHIARVLDAGATNCGRPYFVMELVKGVPITEFCDKKRLSIDHRLELFTTVCRAVQHAHQKGIIHRDLKPSNVMVTLHDGVPVAKVIDFGIAKAINQRLTEKTLFTRYGQMVGTPEYMSPEQAEMNGLDVDTRSDIYSLGALLYELLAGTPPLDGQRLRAVGFAEMLRLICQLDPPTPSLRVSTMGKEATVVSERRSADPKRLAERLRGDLNWIVMKALEKDRTRRYETADALAADVRRHLHDEPVSVGPPTATYRLQKFVRRNRTLVTAGTAVAAALLVGLVLALAGFLEARHQRETARAQAKKAEGILTMLEEMLSAADPTVGKGPDYKVRELLDVFTAGLSNRMQGQPPDVEAAIRSTIGKTYGRLGLQYSAATHLRKACDLRRSQRGEDPQKLADSLTDLAWNAISRCSYEEAEKLANDAVTIYGDMRVRSSPPASAREVLTEAQHDLELQRIARDGIAAYRHEEANEEIDRLLAESNVSPQGTLFALLYLVKLDVGDYVAAQRFAAEHIQRRRGSRSALDQNSYRLGLFCIAFAHHMHGELDKARPLYAELKPNSASFTPEENRWIHMIHAWAILNSEPLNERDLQRATSMIQELAEWISTVPATPFVKWQVYHTLACAHAKAGNLEEAIAAERKALDTIPPYHLFCRSSSEQVLAEYLVQHGDLDEAEMLLRSAVRWRQEKLPPAYVQNSVAETNLAHLLVQRGDEPSYIEAVWLLERACRRLQERPSDDYFKRRGAQQLMGLHAALISP